MHLFTDEKEKLRYVMGIFEGAAPIYHIALLDKPTILWDFHSLLLGLQMIFAFTITDPDSPIHLCKQCEKALYASRQDQQFCSDRCRRYYRMRRHEEDDE